MKADTERTEQEQKSEKWWKHATVLGTWADTIARLLEIILRDR